MCDVNEKFLEGPYLKQHSSSVNEGLFWLDQFSVRVNDSQTLVKFQMDILMCVRLYTSSTLFWYLYQGSWIMYTLNLRKFDH
jgi:hypothetical protein